MEKYLFNDRRKLGWGQVTSAAGFLLYLIGSALALPEGVLAVLLVIFTAVAVWTLLSIIGYPEDKKQEDVTRNTLWGQGSLTLLLAACAYLTLRGLVAA